MAGVANIPLLGGIPLVELKHVCPTARIVPVRHRAAIYRQGAPLRAIFAVIEGQVTLARGNDAGAMVTTAVLSPGEFFGAAPGGAPVSEDTARAKGAVMLWRVPIEEFRRLLLQRPDASWQFIASLAQRQRQMQRRLEAFAFKRVEARLAETFRDLSGGFANRCEHGFGRHLRLSQQELADLVGASRPVVSTILNRLRDQGVLGYNREYVCVRRISDIERLSSG
jgi:CRP/FNR family transcriptional regulator, cyclic AMP receptor protein